MAYQDADRNPSSTAVPNRLRVAFIAALLTAVFMEKALRRMVKVTRGSALSSRAAVSALSFPETPTCPQDPVTGDCSAAPVKNSQLLVDDRQQLDVVVMEGVQ